MAEINKRPFEGIVRLIIAVVLISGFFTINMMNLFCTDGLYPVGAEIAVTSASVLTGAGVLLITAALVFAAVRYLPNKKGVTTIIVILALALRIAFVIFWRIEPQSDFAITLELAELLHKTPFSAWGSALDSYGTVYNNQWSSHMPFVIYQALCGNKVTIQIVNSIFSTFTCIFTAGIAKEIFGEKAGKIALLLSAINPLTLFFMPVLTNQHSATCFFAAAIWCFYKKPIKNNWLNSALCAVLTAISQLLRPEMYVVLIAAAVICVYSILKSGNAVKNVTTLIVYIVVFFAVILSVNSILESNGIAHQSILKGNLKYKIAVGLNKETNGAWSAEDERLIYDESALNEEFFERIKSPSVKMMYGKTSYQFGTYVYPWAMSESSPKISQIIYRRGSAAFMSIALIFAVLGLVLFKNKPIFPICVIFVGYMVVFAVIEIQARYNYLVVPLILVLASGMIGEIMKKIGK
jgi:hypothetical protein